MKLISLVFLPWLFLLLCTFSAGSGVPSFAELDSLSRQGIDNDGRVIAQGAGSSFGGVMYRETVFIYNFYSESTVVSYDSSNSGRGKCRVMSYTTECDTPFGSDGTGTDVDVPIYVDYAGSDSLLKNDQYAAYPDLQMYPAMAGAVVPIFNLGPSAKGVELILTPTLVAQMFRKCFNDTLAECYPNSVTHWNDSRIVQLNPTLQPILEGAGEILPVVRADISGETEIFKKACSEFDSEFQSQIGASSAPTWNGANVTKRIFVKGVMAYVNRVVGTIAYVSLGDALSTGQNIAALSRSGTVIRASQDSIKQAMIEKGLDFGNNGDDPRRLTADLHNTIGDNTWPISSYTYFILRKDTLRPGATCANRKATLEYLSWFYGAHEVDAVGKSKGLAALPETVRDTVLGRLRSDMKCNGVIVYEEEDLPSVTLRVPFALETDASRILLTYNGIVVSSEFVLSTNSDETNLESFLNYTDVSAAVVTGTTIIGKEDLLEQRKDEILFSLLGEIKLVGVYTFCDTGNFDNCAYKDSELVLTRAILADILTGEVTSWSHPSLATLNPEVNLPNETIVLHSLPSSLFGDWEESLRQILSIPQSTPFAPSSISESVAEMDSAMSDFRFSFGIVPWLTHTSDFLKQVNILEAGSIYSPLNPTSERSCNRTVVVGSFLSRFIEDDCYPLYESLIVIMRKSFNGETCNAIETNAASSGATYASFLQWFLSSATTTALESSFLMIPERVTDRRVVNEIMCDGVSILNNTIVTLVRKESDVKYILLAIMVSFVGCLCGVYMMKEYHRARGSVQKCWFIAVFTVNLGGVSLWSSHFIAIRALDIIYYAEGVEDYKVRQDFHVQTTLLSLLVGLVFVFLGTVIASKDPFYGKTHEANTQQLKDGLKLEVINNSSKLKLHVLFSKPWKLILGGIVASVGTSGMMYTAILATDQSTLQLKWEMPLVYGSFLMNGVLLTLTYWVIFRFLQWKAGNEHARTLSAIALTVNVAVLEFCAEASVGYIPVNFNFGEEFNDTDSPDLVTESELFEVAVVACLIILAGSMMNLIYFMTLNSVLRSETQIKKILTGVMVALDEGNPVTGMAVLQKLVDNNAQVFVSCQKGTKYSVNSLKKMAAGSTNQVTPLGLVSM